MTKVFWTGALQSWLKKWQGLLCALALCAFGTAPGPAAASTLNAIYIDTTDTFGFLTLGYPLAAADGQIIDVATSAYGGNSDGALFVLTPGKAGAQYTRTDVRKFIQATASADGEGPLFDLTADKAGDIWGTTGAGGLHGTGILYKLTKPAKKGGKWTYRKVLSLPAGLPGGSGLSALVFDKKGNLFGVNSTACIAAGCAFIWEATAKTLAGENEPVRILAVIPAGNGTDFVEGLAIDEKDNLFSISVAGGTCNGHQGAAWEVSPPAKSGGKWTVQTIHSFCSILDQYTDCVDGANPVYGVAVKDGVLYGATQYGGAGYPFGSGTAIGGGAGVIYSLTPPATTGGAWKFNVVHELVWNNRDGSRTPDYYVNQPNGPPVFSSTGALLLPTVTGGAIGVTNTNPAGYAIEGGVIGIDLPGGAFSIVNNDFAVTGSTPGISGPYQPYGPLSLGATGAIYGASGYYDVSSDTPTPTSTIYEVMP